MNSASTSSMGRAERPSNHLHGSWSILVITTRARRASSIDPMAQANWSTKIYPSHAFVNSIIIIYTGCTIHSKIAWKYRPKVSDSVFNSYNCYFRLCSVYHIYLVKRCTVSSSHPWLVAAMHATVMVIPYSGFISLGANFLEWSVFSFSRNFPDLEIHNPNNRKTHMSEISHEVYARTLASGCW